MDFRFGIGLVEKIKREKNKVYRRPEAYVNETM